MKAIDYDESSTIHPIIIMAVEESNWFTRRGFEFEFRMRPTWQFTIKQRWIRVLMVVDNLLGYLSGNCETMSTGWYRIQDSDSDSDESKHDDDEEEEDEEEEEEEEDVSTIEAAELELISTLSASASRMSVAQLAEPVAAFAFRLCVRLCRRRSQFLRNTLPQDEQLYGLMSVWVSRCVFRLERWLKLRLQTGHLCGDSSKCRILCTARVRDWQNPFPHSPHLNGFSFE